MTATDLFPLADDSHVPFAAERSVIPGGDRARLELRMWRPTSTSVGVHIVGELDMSTAPRLRELLASRLSSTVETMVLDLSELSFLGVAGLELLSQTHQRAAESAVSVRLVDGPVGVARALHAAGMSAMFPTYPTVVAANADLTGSPRENR
ncbi:anti-sigma factor antagonist [Actinopolyspora erythraea]|uniref:Anti-sigma factor antagonist n=1 Tax=Actinopolyspora erythraea TaxID=414996 RepID=A0A223RVT9_9ACTN|nr:STAS domain-containing protein [Actinopolyspora erythraea]ASU79974.1 anti-sigma factor antagonist [Actinopolyspora erythraea]